MSCCKKGIKSKTKDSCCEGEAEEKVGKAVEEASKSGCECDIGKEAPPNKDEKKEASCC